MKAEEFLESYAISDLDVFGRHEEHYSLDNLLNEYARIQIENHNERIKAKYPPCPEYSKTVDSLSTSFRNAVDETPIILD